MQEKRSVKTTYTLGDPEPGEEVRCLRGSRGRLVWQRVSIRGKSRWMRVGVEGSVTWANISALDDEDLIVVHLDREAPLADRLDAALTPEEFEIFRTGFRTLWNIASPLITQQWEQLCRALGVEP